MSEIRHKVFISYHHENDQTHKDQLVGIAKDHYLFIDNSVYKGAISDDLPDERIRTMIRDDYLRDSTVTIVLVGTETKKRKHIDWEIYSSMLDGVKNKKSGILVVNLPSTHGWIIASHGDQEKKNVYPGLSDWQTLKTREEYANACPFMPDRLLDQFVNNDRAKISVTNFSYITKNLDKLKFLIDLTADDRQSCDYNFARPMRKINS